MRSAVLLGLTAGLATVQAHPQRRAPHKTDVLSKRGVDLDSLRMPEIGRYQNSKITKDSKQIKAIGKRSTYLEAATEVVRTVAPGAEFRVVRDHYVGSNGVAHVNFKQIIQDVDVDNADFHVNVAKDGSILSFGNSFYTGEAPKENALKKRDVATPVTALKDVVELLGLPIDAPDGLTSAVDDDEANHFSITGTTGAQSDPKARLVYLLNAEGELSLTWRVETDVLDNWLLTYVDATVAATGSTPKIHASVDYVSDIATYQVYPWPIVNPVSGNRAVLEDPWLDATSEFTWLGDGTTDYETTRGNNGIAQVNPTGGNQYENNYRPEDAELTFEYPYTLNTSDPESYRDASITQLFYTANVYHDVLHTLGFTEEAGNFETNNNGAGGQGGDEVILNAQDGSGTNNANFATPPDGQNGRMRMYIWDASTPVRDCSFDASVVIHEYTHGLSTRLTGGPANSGCLGGIESGGMGEGWSDFMSLAIRLLPADTRSTDYPMGDWVSSDPGGIREYVYSTNTNTNPLTYSAADGQGSVHAVGTIWATALYEVMWNLVDKHGKSDESFPEFDDAGVPTDGKFLSMKIVMDGMALQPCNPTMVTARDAIIDADEALTGGANACEIWTGFAKRGLGEGAQYSATARTEDFEVPVGVC